jgi:hypothetical protein
MLALKLSARTPLATEQRFTHAEELAEKRTRGDQDCTM